MNGTLISAVTKYRIHKYVLYTMIVRSPTTHLKQHIHVLPYILLPLIQKFSDIISNAMKDILDVDDLLNCFFIFNIPYYNIDDLMKN